MKFALSLLLLVAATSASAQEVARDCTRYIYLDDFHDKQVDCPSVELALRFIKENPRAYRRGTSDAHGEYDWYLPTMAIYILRQEYAPYVLFSRQEQDALADELAQLYMYGSAEQSFIAMDALRIAADENGEYDVGTPYERSIDLFIEIFETLTAEYPDGIVCYVECPEPISRAQSALEKIRIHGGQRGQEYHAKVWAPIHQRSQAKIERARREQARRQQ